MKTNIFIQARLSSSRYPGKMLEAIVSDMPLLEFVYRRCATSVKACKVAVITSDESSDDPLAHHCLRLNIPCFRGPLDDVLGRFVQAAKEMPSDLIVRVCGDSPFVDIAALDQLIDEVDKSNADYGIVTDCIDGFTSEVMTMKALQEIDTKSTGKDEREHVTAFIRKHPESFNTVTFKAGIIPNCGVGYKMTVDYPEDMLVAREIASGLNDFYFTAEDVISRFSKIETVI